MIRIGGGDGPPKVSPVEPAGRAGDKSKDELRRDPKPAEKSEGEIEEVPRPRRAPDPGTGENVDIDV